VGIRPADLLFLDLLDFREEVPECGDTTSASADSNNLRFDYFIRDSWVWWNLGVRLLNRFVALA
jgi:hypothetical protein